MRPLSTNVDKAKWGEAWAKDVDDIRSDVTYEQSAERLRKIIRTAMLRFTDIRDDPEKFFLAHRLLAKHSTTQGPGFWIRFTVQYNLFAGTIVAVGGPEQVKQLDEFQSAGAVGCFGLTERFAGVNSGLVVQTVADWDAAAGGFRLHSPSEGAFKNWISQGLTADKCVVLADLRVNGQSKGPHAFVMDLRRGGKVVPGVTLGDMGRKTTGNDLDNAWLQFTDVRLPKSALLNRYCDIVNGEYVQKVAGIQPMAMIGQRLFTGRVAVAQAALAFRRQLFDQTRRYSDHKKCWMPGAEPSLSMIPQLKALYAEAEAKASDVERFVAVCERELAACLRADRIPPADLIGAIAVAKVKAVETSIDLCFRLKQEVGSYALMGDAGFEHMDFLQCCKFAEGDSRILMQKMARDRVRAFSKKPTVTDEETRLCAELTAAVDAAADKAAAWDENWQKVYALAEATMQRVTKEYLAKPKL